MNPVTDVREISSIGYGFMASKALFTALDLDIFTRLSSRPQDLAALAQAVGVRPNQLLTLMTALVCLGLVVKEAEVYANAPASETYLARSSPKYYGDYFRLQIDKQFYPSLLELTASFRGERKGFYETFLADPVQADLFSRAQHVGSLGAADLARRAWHAARRRWWQRRLQHHPVQEEPQTDRGDPGLPERGGDSSAIRGRGGVGLAHCISARRCARHRVARRPGRGAAVLCPERGGGARRHHADRTCGQGPAARWTSHRARFHGQR